MLTLREVSSLGSFESLSSFSLKVERGEIVAILGDERSGKRLVGQVLSGWADFRTGRININHYDLDRQKIRALSQIGYLSNPVVAEDFLTGFEYLDMVASSYHIAPRTRSERIKQLIDQLDFGDSAYGVLEKVTNATLQKVGLAASLIHQPSVLILDEPLQHLDWAGKVRASSLIKDAGDGAIILLITDDLALAEQWANRLIIMSAGEIVIDGTLKQLVNQVRPAKGTLAEVYETVTGS